MASRVPPSSLLVPGRLFTCKESIGGMARFPIFHMALAHIRNCEILRGRLGGFVPRLGQVRHLAEMCRSPPSWCGIRTSIALTTGAIAPLSGTIRPASVVRCHGAFQLP